jgi:hypothetical protein
VTTSDEAAAGTVSGSATWVMGRNLETASLRIGSLVDQPYRAGRIAGRCSPSNRRSAVATAFEGFEA